ncbi:uncharacterized protein LOC112637218 [Camponotus floridanus]|uniref:uncharacterized protein LOC112637218 n=1 Tax=Camponotus floridanus TaxID=104421 RepID=UPI000DC6C3AD|nr:uncharacterized protein LOC112637218 [Camponotus floridanus]
MNDENRNRRLLPKKTKESFKLNRNCTNRRSFGGLSNAEICYAHRLLILTVQEFYFLEVVFKLRAGKQIQVSSKLLALNPFIDEKGLLRVGGRIQNSKMTFEFKHPIILPLDNRERVLLGKLHTSALLVLNKPKTLSQIMGQLSADRVIPKRPFFVTGMDFAGPITTLINKGRGRKTNKSYISLFVCFTTKAIHLEAVSDLSSASFIAALRRFTGRRGYPQRIYCDNATNFVESKNEICEMYDLIEKEERELNDNFCIPNRIEWKFIPPASPHMGGLWEAGVKSSADLQPLTPGHFLIGGPMTALPNINITELPTNRLDRWQTVQKITQLFWKRWSKEYLTSLQGRIKWTREQINLSINDIVIIQDNNAPPLKWRLGRVIELHKGTDDKVRVVTLQTAKGTCKRAINKLCKLPLSDVLFNHKDED